MQIAFFNDLPAIRFINGLLTTDRVERHPLTAP